MYAIKDSITEMFVRTKDQGYTMDSAYPILKYGDIDQAEGRRLKLLRTGVDGQFFKFIIVEI